MHCALQSGRCHLDLAMFLLWGEKNSALGRKVDIFLLLFDPWCCALH